jgi:hypothetical protein
MSAVTHMWRQLVQRRLWPVAILLIAALVAVPLTLAKEPEAEPPAPAPQVDHKSELATTPIVAQAAPQDRAKRRKVLGKAKNPFAVAKAAKAESKSDTATTVVQKTGSGKSDDVESNGGGSPSGGGTTSPSPDQTPSQPVEPTPPPKTYAYGELTVRFGSSENTQRQSVKRLQPLPSPDEPVLIYMGLLRDGKTAEFLVDHGVVPVGDGECRPSPEECQTVRLRAGETEFFDITDADGNVSAQYQLDLIKIHKGSGASASRARAASTKAAAARLAEGRSALRSTVGRTTARLP